MKVLKLISALLLLSPFAAAAAQTPAPQTQGVEQRVEAILKQMTLEEKIDLLSGVNDFFVRDIKRLGLPRLKMADGPMGVRNFGPATAMAAGVGLA
ncbi:MAG TPA: hypothetical protein VF621_13890, partial [Pyrinomonadaceae bacterium]